MTEAPAQSARIEVVVNTPEQLQTAPFVIRAHHLGKLREFLVSGKSASTIAKEDVAMILWESSDIVMFVDPKITAARKKRKKDMLGDTPQEAERFERAIVEFFDAFNDLPGNHPVKIAVGQKDHMCNGAAVGAHCDSFAKGEYAPKDPIHVGVFKTVATELGLRDEVIEVEEMLNHPDAYPIKVTSLITTAQTVRNVVTSPNYAIDLRA